MNKNTGLKTQAEASVLVFFMVISSKTSTVSLDVIFRSAPISVSKLNKFCSREGEAPAEPVCE